MSDCKVGFEENESSLCNESLSVMLMNVKLIRTFDDQTGHISKNRQVKMEDLTGKGLG